MPSVTDKPGEPERDDEARAERGRVLIAAAVADAQVPAALRERIVAQRTRTAPVRRRRRAALGALAAGAVAAVLAIALLAAPDGTPGSPSLSQAAALGARPAQQPPPARDSANPRLLLISEGGIRFPAWDSLRWPASGTRHDRIAGRDSTTVFYRAGPSTIAYTIVDGRPLRGTDARRVRTLRMGGRTVVVWQRDGHTCIITAPPGVPAGRLTGLTSWS